MVSSVVSRSGVRIRLTDECWVHIVEEHCELAGMREEILETITGAERVFGGHGGELPALREVDTQKFLVVVYKETSGQDGFVITAFLTKRIKGLDRRTEVWPAKP